MKAIIKRIKYFFSGVLVFWASKAMAQGMEMTWYGNVDDEEIVASEGLVSLIIDNILYYLIGGVLVVGIAGYLFYKKYKK